MQGGSAGARWPRRRVLRAIAMAGAGSAVFGRALAALAEGRTRVTTGMIREAEWIAGLRFTADDRKLMLDGVNESLGDYARLRAVRLDNAVAPALWFDPRPGQAAPAAGARGAVALPDEPSARRPSADDDLAFLPVSRLAPLLRARKVSSVELTRLYLDRLRRHDEKLKCVVTLTEKMALRQAEQADRDLAAGVYRGPLHGVPWGAKDLLAVEGYPTTWGSVPYRKQMRAETATVAARLASAGAVLAAKLSVGELAWGDVWFGGMTRNPWNTAQGSSGSSAGSACAAAAGLAGFTIGTETWGSIVSPCTRCGVTGLRPTFGRVSRHGAMALSWSMDKIGPIARSVEDCALVFAAIHGADGIDPTAVDRLFEWPPRRDPRSLKVGYVKTLFDEDRSSRAEDPVQKKALEEWQRFDRRTLDVLQELGVELVPIDLPSTYPVAALSVILGAEASTAFDELTRDGRDDQMVRQVADAWPNVFRQGQLVPAVEYLRANRIRSLVMQEMEQLMATVDVYVAPSYGGDNLLLTNLTGHPCVVLPNGFRSGDGTPTSISFLGRLHEEADLMGLARLYQEATDFHLKRPPLAAG
ncbi:MAG TPA: amidase [Candidatus Polarisedimenticolia bacterium]|nr:amidase [Candidatus Polarisedimenticolia bacterium]